MSSPLCRSPRPPAAPAFSQPSGRATLTDPPHARYGRTMASDRTRRGGAVSAVREGDELDWASIGRWLREAVPELTGPLNVLQFPHGRANLTYLLEIGDTPLVA